MRKSHSLIVARILHHDVVCSRADDVAWAYTTAEWMGAPFEWRQADVRERMQGDGKFMETF